MIEQKIQMITSFLIRTIGPIILRMGLGGGAAAGTPKNNDNDDDFDFDENDDLDNDIPTANSDNENKVDGTEPISVSLPTFTPELANKFDDETSSENNANSESSTTTAPARINLLDLSDSSLEASSDSATILPAPITTETQESQSQNILDSVR